MSVIERLSKQVVADAALIEHLRGEARQHKDAYLAMREENGILRNQLAGAVEDRAKLLGWIHEVSGHFVDDAERCRSCTILVKYLELSERPS